MKCVLSLLTTLFLSYQCMADIREYDTQTAQNYLTNVSAVMLVYKLDGDLPSDVYANLLKVTSSVSEEELFNLWKINTRDSDVSNRFLVLKSYAGKFSVGEYIYADEHSSITGLIERDAISLVFFKENKKGKLNFTPCRVVSSMYLTDVFFKLKTKDEVVKYVIEHEPNLCFSREELIN
jgi:hypothetical protein